LLPAGQGGEDDGIEAGDRHGADTHYGQP
jgi:hypothetical protein